MIQGRIYSNFTLRDKILNWTLIRNKIKTTNNILKVDFISVGNTGIY